MTDEDKIIKLIYEVQQKKSFDSKFFNINFSEIEKIILNYCSNKEKLTEWGNLIKVYKIQNDENCIHPNIEQDVLNKTLDLLKDN
ncbi:MAG: hypothetical protein ACOVQR_12895 [Flavobacterium sp.]|jgi:hypothetical protein|uniref:hypothetical protein n=1 Tax=Flavobacterium sp. TaxID=239 RepID=UPI003BA5BC91